MSREVSPWLQTLNIPEESSFTSLPNLAKAVAKACKNKMKI